MGSRVWKSCVHEAIVACGPADFISLSMRSRPSEMKPGNSACVTTVHRLV